MVGDPLGAQVAAVRGRGDVVPVPLAVAVLERAVLEDPDAARLGREVVGFLAGHLAGMAVGAVLVVDEESVLAHGSHPF